MDMDSELNKKIQERIERLRLYNISTRYRVGCDIKKGESKSAYVVFDKGLNAIRYVTTKKLKIKLGLLTAKILGWEIVRDGGWVSNTKT